MADVPAFNSSLNVAVRIPDITPPRLVSFSLDLNTDVVRLTFDETINAQSVSFLLLYVR